MCLRTKTFKISFCTTALNREALYLISVFQKCLASSQRSMVRLTSYRTTPHSAHCPLKGLGNHQSLTHIQTTRQKSTGAITQSVVRTRMRELRFRITCHCDRASAEAKNLMQNGFIAALQQHMTLLSYQIIIGFLSEQLLRCRHIRYTSAVLIE